MARRIPNRYPSTSNGLLVSSLMGLSLAVVLALPSAEAMVRPRAVSLVPEHVPTTQVSDPLLLEAEEAERQAGVLYGARRYEEALRAQRHSVEIHRQLVARDPSQTLQLAASLHNLGVVLIRMGRKAEAIPPTEESLALYRQEALAHAGDVPLAMERPLRNLALLFFETNRPQAALPLADDLVRLHQSLAVVDPLSSGERMDVLNLRASLYVALNRPQEALQDLKAAVSLGRTLAQLAPQNLALQYGLAGSLMNLSQVADVLRQFDQALPPAREAEAILRQAARQQPQLAGDWAKAQSRLGQAYAMLGDPSRARPALEESIAQLRSLARSPVPVSLSVEVGGYRDDLAHALETLAGVLQQVQLPEQARAAGVEAMEIYSKLAQEDPRYVRDVERTRSWLSGLPPTTPTRR